MRGFSRTVQLALDIISTFASDMTLASTPEELATAYFQAIGGRDTQSLSEPIKSRTIRQIKKLSDPKVSELALGILSNFSSSITNIFTKQELWDEYQKFVEIAKSLPEPISGETILALARIWFPKSNSESLRYSFGKKLKSSQKNQINFFQKLARCNNISIFKIRKDRKGYTKTPLTIPQLKSRLTRNGISYKMNKSKFGMMIPEGELPPVATIEEMATGRERADRINDYKREMEYTRPRLEASAAEEGRRVYNEVWNMRPIGPDWTESQRLYQAEAHSKRASEWLLKNYYARSREFELRNAISTINDRRLADQIYRRVGIEWDEAFASFMADKAAREAARRRLREAQESLD